ncbi:general transcriptional corepressor CYC8 [Nematocida homosporus]|uniref:general transcriptional corepressor CYC8 n=1 Tax=Nematocida homosporus TaxID=1912981 RepID=UPI002220F9D4|nr:general transcriptional corepressor CYC8 [Nematocida homosporus]KAI5188022.1 general transcriptional corepressor CYC8 [Nematocida homosporus]
MDSDTKINFQPDSWHSLPGLERVPTPPLCEMPDIYTKLLLENEASWLSIASLFREFRMDKNVCYAYERALANNPLSREALESLGPIYRTQKQWDKALDLYLRLYKLSSGVDIDSATSIAFCYLMLDRFSESLIWFKLAAQHAAAIKKEKGFLWFGVGVFYERVNNLQIAEEAYASAIKVNLPYEYSLETYFRLGVTYKKRGAIQTAKDCFEYLLHNLPKNQTRPSKEDVLVQVAHVHDLQGRTLEAIGLLQEIVSSRSSSSSSKQVAVLLLSWLYYKEGNWLGVQGTIQELGTGELGGFTWYLLGRVEHRLENYKEAYRCYHAAIRKDGKNHLYWNSMGILYYGLGQYEDAMGAFQKARNLHPLFVEAVYNLGAVYEQFAGTLGSALEVYEGALEVFPEDKLLLERLEEVADRRASEVEGVYLPPEVPLRDVQPNPTNTPYFLAHSLLGYRPTSFVFNTETHHADIESIVEHLHNAHNE